MTLKRLSHPVPVVYNETQGVYLSDILANAHITLRECGVGVATVTVDNDFSAYPDYVVGNDSLIISVGETTATAQPVFKGRVQFPNSTVSKEKNQVDLILQHSGYGLCDMFVAQQYGAQSRNLTLDTLKEILTDSTHGVIPAFVDKQFGGAASGWSLNSAYLSDHIANPTNVINWIESPYKTADKIINDLVDRVTALEAGDPGPHWIVDNHGFFRLKILGTSQSGAAGSGAPDWTLWYGGTDNAAGQATIRLGEDNNLVNYEEMKSDGTYIVNYGTYRYPASGDSLTESHNGWGSTAAVTISTDVGTYAVGSASVKAAANGTAGARSFYYPSSKDWHIDTTQMGSPKYVPRLNFMVRRYNGGAALPLGVKLFTDDTHNYKAHIGAYVVLEMPDNDVFYSFSIPIGPYWKNVSQDYKWQTDLANPLDWSDVNWIEFTNMSPTTSDYYNIDSLYFGDFPVIRVAMDSSQPVTRMRFINDMSPCDDSLVAADDSGTMAQLTAAELFRQNKTVYCPTIQVPILPDALPGQQFSFNSNTYRAMQIDHHIVGDDMTTTLTLTSDLTNGLARKRYEDYNKQLANQRPNTQDRNATSMSRDGVDYNVPRLIKDYTP